VEASVEVETLAAAFLLPTPKAKADVPDVRLAAVRRIADDVENFMIDDDVK